MSKYKCHTVSSCKKFKPSALSMYALCNIDKAKQQKEKFQLFNPLSPNIHIQILQTALHTFP